MKTKKVSTIKLAIFFFFFWFKVWAQTRNKDLRILISQIKAFFCGSTVNFDGGS